MNIVAVQQAFAKGVILSIFRKIFNKFSYCLGTWPE